MQVAAKLARWSPWLTRASGVLLVVLGVVHLIATPFYLGWSGSQLRPEHAALLVAGMRLNHVLVGILLIPLGISTYWAGRELRESWAVRLAALNALTLLSLPTLLLLTMPLKSLDAPLFRLAILVLSLACLLEILALGGVWLMRRQAGNGDAATP